MKRDLLFSVCCLLFVYRPAERENDAGCWNLSPMRRRCSKFEGTKKNSKVIISVRVANVSLEDDFVTLQTEFRTQNRQ